MQAKQKLEKTIIELFNDENDKFYSYIFFRVNRKEDNNCPTMGVGFLNNFLTLIYNKDYIEKLNFEHLKTILKHEALHIISNHLSYEKNGDKSLLNIAMDVAINQLLNQTHVKQLNGITLDSFRDFLKYVDKSLVVPNQTHKYYYDLLIQEKQQRQNNKELFEIKFDKIDEHGLGENENTMDVFSSAIVESIIKEALEKSKTIPRELKEILSSFLNSQIDWRTELRNFVSRTQKCDKTLTRGRRNRRFGIKVSGKRHSYYSKLLVILDTSGSMTLDNRTNLALAEIEELAQCSPESKIMICEADDEIREVFEYSGGEITIKGRGGTDIQPAFDYAANEGYDAIICISDMEYLHDIKDVGIETLFVCTANSYAENSFGKIIHVV